MGPTSIRRLLLLYINDTTLKSYCDDTLGVGELPICRLVANMKTACMKLVDQVTLNEERNNRKEDEKNKEKMLLVVT